MTYYHTWDSPDKRSFYNYSKYVTLRGGGNTHLMIAVTSSPWEGYKSGPPYLCKGTFPPPHPNSEQAPHSKLVSSLTFEEVGSLGFHEQESSIELREVFSHNPLIINKGTKYWKIRSYSDLANLSPLLDSQRHWKVHQAGKILTWNKCATAVVQEHKHEQANISPAYTTTRIS